MYHEFLNGAVVLVTASQFCRLGASVFATWRWLVCSFGEGCFVRSVARLGMVVVWQWMVGCVSQRGEVGCGAAWRTCNMVAEWQSLWRRGIAGGVCDPLFFPRDLVGLLRP